MTCIMILVKGEWRFVRFGWLFDKRGIAIVSKEKRNSALSEFRLPPFAQSVAGLLVKRIGYRPTALLALRFVTRRACVV
jgi:hypothetical protein